MTPAFKSLVWKEWLGLRPIAILIVVLFIFGLFYAQVSEFLDQYTLWEDYFAEIESSVIIGFIFCAMISMGLLVREKDEGTLLYLDGLPVKRSSIYLAKWIVAVLLSGVIDVMFFIECFTYDWLSRESDMPARSWRSYGIYFGLHWFQMMFFVSLFFSLSFLRRWSILVIGALFWAIYWMKSMQIPYAEWLDPFSLIQIPENEEDYWIIPWGHLGFLTAIGAGLWLIGLGIFATRFDSIRQSSRSCWAKALGVFAIILIIIVWFGFLITTAVFEGEEYNEDESEYSEELTSRIDGAASIVSESTERFQFVFFEKDRKKAEPLLSQADEIYQEVATFFELDDSKDSGRIVVDLANPVGSHNAGQAHWKKIRMVIPAENSKLSGDAILGHEVTHVLIDQITDGRLEENWGSIRWFHEGLASYVEFEFFAEPDAKVDYERWLALASTWEEVDFAELVDNEELTEKRDSFLVYAAGRLWVESAVEVYGPKAPVKLTRALGRPDGPRNMDGLARWRDACLASDMDLERIRSQFRNRLRELRDEYAEICESYPEVQEATAVRQDGKIIITPELPEGSESWEDVIKSAPAGSKLMVRARPETDAEPLQWRYVEMDESGKFELSAFSFLKPQLGVQFGWLTNGWTENPVFGEWNTITAER